MNYYSYCIFLLLNISSFIWSGHSAQCGCKMLRPCYKHMLDTLLDQDEASCIEDVSVGINTVIIFLKALKQFCGEFIDILEDGVTYEGRHLYEVVVHHQDAVKANDKRTKPVMIIEAGQDGGNGPVMLALYAIQQLVACQELNHMIENVRWIILPCVNPDGMEFSRQEIPAWRKNIRPLGDQLSLGVDITRNFDTQWGSCPKVNSEFSQTFPGFEPASENETIFLKQALLKYKNDAKIYLSIKRDGHSIGYPYANTKGKPPNSIQLIKVATEVTTRVNQITGGINLFANNSIFELEGKAHCGHSVDYAYDQGIHLAFEMRVFLDQAMRFITKFHTLPRGYEASLRNGYFSAIKELYTVVTNERKYGRIV